MTEQQDPRMKPPQTWFPRWAFGLVVLAIAVGVFMMRPALHPRFDADESVAAAVDMPRLVELGADKCIPCKMMAPILEELTAEYPEVFSVDFIDVWKNTDASTEYGIKVIPTQIFYAADGTELFRHEGFFAKEDILAKWREFGLEI
jgi:thioredoxin 1